MKVVIVVGTRPEAIKLAPIILRLRQKSGVSTTLVATAQHRDLLDQVLSEFELAPDYDLGLMTPGQALAEFAGRCLMSLNPVICEIAPNVVIAQGDTTTTLAASLVSFYNKIPFVHIEAGLRTGDFQNPFPEEFNRVAVSQLTDLHMAPTDAARENLLREGVMLDKILVTGNTVIDALLSIRDRVEGQIKDEDQVRRVLVTIHRRENFGEPLRSICRAIKRLVNTLDWLHIVWPAHPNPQVHDFIHQFFHGHERVHLLQPLGYSDFVRAMMSAELILTDSGGVQEEAPSLRKPVLVLREETERPEGIAAGVARLIGTDEDHIVESATRLLVDKTEYASMQRDVSPYGDGQAADRIAAEIWKRYKPHR